ncbi:hypothetical protein [Stenotrophomonas sp.]|uniref:hypothetical protein n=1 Tax=Stenotrophomonas sp. TaxID=69392 RepID=UPI002D21F943|nr:hypothetical protein [Stenotrophomonas sp.]HYQ24232.1 hypothetical protein [Stenotrophomonas sp.]
MTTPTSFRILRISALLRINGSLKNVEAVICNCQACGNESRLSAGVGLEEVPSGVQLTCPICRTSAEVPTAQFTAQWAEQLRRDRILTRAGIDPSDLYGPWT